jgi:hypothetical protein
MPRPTKGKMAENPSDDIRVSPTLQPLRRWLRLAQKLKLAPILIGETYRLQVSVENLSHDRLENVVLECTIGMRTHQGFKRFPSERMMIQHIAPLDRTSVQSTNCLMVETGSGEIEIQTFHSTRLQLSPVHRTLYFVESWNVMVGRVTAIIVVMTFLLTLLTKILQW